MVDATVQAAPRARSRGLVIRELEGEVLIFDVDRNQAHCLNQTAGLVWQRCDGQTSVETIRQELEGRLETPVSVEIVWKALAELDRDNLLDEQVSQPASGSKMSRRDLMRRAGVTLAIPVIASIAVPTGAFAAGASVRTCGSPCTDSSQCKGCNGNTGQDSNGEGDGSGGRCAGGGGGCSNMRRCCANAGAHVTGCSSRSMALKMNCQCCTGRCDRTGMRCLREGDS